jgi:queuine tRNA-ribosyltransferase
MEIQKNLGADIIFAFDECTSPTETYEYQKESLVRTHKWAQESLEVHTELDPEGMQALFGVVQGAQFEDLRKLSAQELANMKSSNGREFEGFGIGGSFSKDDMTTAVDWVTKVLPTEKPRHLLGIGEPLDLFMGVEQGIDFFDCVAPTRMARHGTVYTNDGRLNLMNEKCTTEMAPIDLQCKCYTCKNFTQSYVAHLFRAKEMLAATLASIHNMHFINNLVMKMRESILNDTFVEYKKEFLKRYYK